MSGGHVLWTCRRTSGVVARIVLAESGLPHETRFVDLRAGEYAVTFTLQGFTTVKREGVALEGAFTATINADLRVGTPAPSAVGLDEGQVAHPEALRQPRRSGQRQGRDQRQRWRGGLVRLRCRGRKMELAAIDHQLAEPAIEELAEAEAGAD